MALGLRKGNGMDEMIDEMMIMGPNGDKERRGNDDRKWEWMTIK
jgi:hypothetical protein